MSSFLLTEIALDLLGNKFYTADGQHVRDLQTLYKLSGGELPTGEPSLQALLCISETSLRAADNLQSDVIVLDDEEDLKSKSETTNATVKILDSPPRKPSKFTQRKKSKSKFRTESRRLHSQEEGGYGNRDSYQEFEAELQSSTFKAKSTDRRFKLKLDPKLHTGDVNQRLSHIVKACTEEYAQMKDESNTEKENFLQIQATSPSEEENIQMYYKQEKENLLKESKMLMDFLRIIRNDSTYPKDMLIRVESDILKAKNLIFQ